MKKVLLAVFVALSVPATAGEIKGHAHIQEVGPFPVGKELLTEINSAAFAPRLFSFGWETTIRDAENKKFACSRNKTALQVNCVHSGYSLLPDSKKTPIAKNLRLSFARQDKYCANKLTQVTYTEVIPSKDDEGWFSPEKFKLVKARYDTIVTALQEKYNKYRFAEKRLVGSVFADYVWGHQWGQKIDVATVQIEDNYQLSVIYRAQCATDKWLAHELSEREVDNSYINDLKTKL